MNGSELIVTPEDVGAHILLTLKKAAEKELSAPVTKAVMSVPAEFDDLQRNYTIRVGDFVG